MLAGVQQLVHPLLSKLAELPPLQARTLRTAFAIEEGPVPDRFAVLVATLSLLAGAAVEQPLLCVVDDAQWLDQVPAEALTFAARRLHADAVVMLFAAREPDSAMFAAPGLAGLTLTGLTPPDAKALLRVGAADIVEYAVDRLMQLTHGNPLALLEISRALSSEQRSGRVPLDEPLPVGAEVERAFLARGRRRFRRTPGVPLYSSPLEILRDPDAIWQAFALEGVAREVVLESEAVGLLQPGRLDFCHPLARSAVYLAVRRSSAAGRTLNSRRSRPSRAAARGNWHRQPSARTWRPRPPSRPRRATPASGAASRPRHARWSGRHA